MIVVLIQLIRLYDREHRTENKNYVAVGLETEPMKTQLANCIALPTSVTGGIIFNDYFIFDLVSL